MPPPIDHAQTGPRPSQTPARATSRPSRERRLQPRGEHTQRLLLDAAIACIVEHGYSATSTREISERAGISRGAQQHHFPRKAELVAQAIRRLAERRLDELTRRADQLPSGPARIPDAIDLFWESFSGDLFQASVEVWMASRNDPALQQSLAETERHVASAIVDSATRMFGPDIAAHPSFPDDIQLALNTMRGITLLRIFQPGDRAYQRQWKSAREHLLNHFAARQQSARPKPSRS